MSIKNLFWGSLLIGIVVRVYIICLPAAELLNRWGSDDLFYYTQIAGHIANGDGASFDGVNPTNGFQPLFMGLLLPFGDMLLENYIMSLKIVLILVSILTLFTALQVKALFSYWLQENTGMIVGAFIMVHPKILSVTFHGTEAALALLMIVLSLRAVQQIESGKNLFWASLAFTGLVLTRFDYCLLLAVFTILLLLKGIPMRRLALIALLPAIAFSCWLFANWYLFGNPIPDSGAAKSLHGAYLSGLSAQNPVISVLFELKGALHTVLMAESRLSIVVFLLVLSGILRLGIVEITSWRGPFPYFLALAIGGFLIAMAAIVKLHGFRDWYLIPLFLVVLWLMSLGVEFLIRQFTHGPWFLVVIPILIWGNACMHPRKHMAPYYLETALFIEKNIPHGTRIGAFNAGLYGAVLGKNYPVINLDGVVNHEVIDALGTKQLYKYIENEGIEVLVDHSGSVRFFSNFSGVDLDEKFEIINVLNFEGETSDITVYKRKSTY